MGMNFKQRNILISFLKEEPEWKKPQDCHTDDILTPQRETDRTAWAIRNGVSIHCSN